MAPLASLTDTFDDGVIDTIKWPGAAGNVSETGGRARVEVGSGFARFTSDAIYTLTGSAFCVTAWMSAADPSASQAWTQLLVRGSVDGGIQVDIGFERDAVADVLRCQYRYDFWDPDSVAIPYDPDEHHRLRVVEDAGSVYFQTSPDGIAWTTQRTVLTPAWASDTTLDFQIIAHRVGGVTDYSEFDDLNVISSSVAFDGGGYLAARGRVVALPSVAVPQRWQILAGPRTGGYETELTSLHERRLSLRLKDPSELSFTLDGRAEEANVLLELRTDLHVLWRDANGETWILFRGRLGTTQDNITADAHRLDCTALDYRAVLRRRILYSDRQLVWNGVDQGEIAWGLVQQTQVLNGGDLGIAKSWTGTTPTGYLRDWEFKAGDNIGERITEVGEAPDGYDWDIVPVSASALQLWVWSPRRGVDRGVVLEYGGLITSVNREVAPSAYANSIRYTGKDELTAYEQESADIPTAPEGRWDAVYGDSTLEVQQCLNERGAWQLEEARVVRPTYTVTLQQGEWYGPSHIWLGDPVRLIVDSGRLDHVDTTLRVYGLDFAITDEGTETITLTLDQPPLDYRQRPAETERRITNLERR